MDEIAKQFNCAVHVMTADIGDERQAADLLSRIRRELPQLGGVAHLAGVLDDALLTQQSWSRFETVMAPKVAGALHLHRLTQGDDLDFFLFYSSASSVLGSPGQANYASANALLDGLAAYRGLTEWKHRASIGVRGAKPEWRQAKRRARTSANKG